MIVGDILRESAGRRCGYSPQSVGPTSLDPDGLLERLKRIPSKITAYFRRELIASVYKSDYCRDPRDEYYIIVTTDGTRFHVDY